jgi:hypothetical protein
LRHYATSWKVAGSIPDEVMGRTMVLGSTQSLTEMSSRKLPGGKRRPARKADNLTAICEQIVYKVWDLYVSLPYGLYFFPAQVFENVIPQPHKIIYNFLLGWGETEFTWYVWSIVPAMNERR